MIYSSEARGESSARGNGFGLSLRDGLARHPEWWTLAVSLAAWILLAVHDDREPSTAFCGTLHSSGTFVGFEWVTNLTGSFVMTVAMMLPLAVAPVRRTAHASLWRRRHRAIAGFLVGYGAIWISAGGAALACLAIWRPDHWTAVAGFAVASLWELTPLKRRALSLCHRTVPLRPLGWHADLDCLRYGLAHGRDCLMSCWAIMLGALLAANHLPVMAGLTALSVAQRHWPRRRHRIEATALAAAAVCLAAIALA
jgi:predicted metal-binding membrane protein